MMPKLAKITTNPTVAAFANVPQVKSRTTPLWRGPEQDGVTFSMLCKFLVCRERFRLYVLEGLQDADRFNHRIFYGSAWHVCEESYAANRSIPTALKELLYFSKETAKQYPLDQEQVEKWHNVCRVQFPLYVEYWSKHPDTINRTPLLQEQVFNVLYQLPSGRTVRLRGKWDSVDLVGKGKAAGIWLQENKTKGDIDERQLKRQLTFDLQTMTYFVALSTCREQGVGLDEYPPETWLKVQTSPQPDIVGVRYNVVRRPLSGGKGTIVRHKPSKSNPQGESEEHYYNRLADYIKEGPETYFMRWNVPVSTEDIAKFRSESLDPILEQLCDWWYWITFPKQSGTDHFDVKEQLHKFGSNTKGLGNHFRMPFGVYSPLLDGGETALDEYLAGGSEAGLGRVSNLYPELS